MSKSIRVLAFSLTVLVSAVTAYAEDSPSCRDKCTTDYTDCLKSIESASPDARVILEKSCQVEDDACSADCDEKRSLAGILRKLSE
ncbi:hypothetical protein [Geomonas ferrireducens]|uniref:hypothetical protein n=1 Tax=Geomonas ferrireducens TaxID=2570227 RepID=UPI0010A7BB41|nr:hypothetical protein [Geomonas ferrireducens]